MSSHRATNPDIEADVPGEVTQFLKDFDRSLNTRDVHALNDLYEKTLPVLDATFYNNKPQRGVDRSERAPFRAWPAMKFIKSNCFSSPTMEKVYMMIFYKKLYTDRSVAPNVRVKSWENFKDLINVLIKASKLNNTNSKDAVDLPNGLLWDIFDELLFQLQSLFNNKNRPTNGKDWPADAWSIPVIFDLLDNIISETECLKKLSGVKTNEDAATYLTTTGPIHVSRALGVFALISKARLNVLLGDYVSALEDLEPLNIFTTGRILTTQAAPAHVAVFYNVGFAYMMLRRYTDAVTTLKMALAVKAANRSYVDTIQAHVVSLITISATLGCLSVEDVTQGFGVERSRQEEDAQLLGNGDVDRYREMFWKACPKFISLVDTTQSYTEITGQEGKDLQLRVFMRAVQQQVDALRLRGYLRVYSTINGSKIQSLLSSSSSTAADTEPTSPTSEGQSAELMANAHLACLKHKSSEKVHSGTSAIPTAGELQSTAAIDFGVKVDHVSVVHRKHTEPPARRFATLLSQLK